MMTVHFLVFIFLVDSYITSSFILSCSYCDAISKYSPSLLMAAAQFMRTIMVHVPDHDSNSGSPSV